MKNFDKNEIKEQINTEDIFGLLDEWGGEPEYTNFGILATTICHNHPGEGSRKLYYYENSRLFKCYTDCDSSFDIFELTSKIAMIQSGLLLDLNGAIKFLAYKLNLNIPDLEDQDEITLPDWKYFNAYNKIKSVNLKEVSSMVLKTYDKSILNCFKKQHFHLSPWIHEGISEETMQNADIGYCFSTDQIIIPHFDINNNLVGIRGRTMCKQEAELYGKYRPLYLNHKLYNHPLGMNLYNINNAKENIGKIEKAIVFEAEKSCLLYRTYFGSEVDISVASCGSSLSSFQFQLLRQSGVKELVLAFDRQFQDIGDDEFKRLTRKLINLNEKYKKECTVSIIFDKRRITGYKASPIDEGKEKFLQLFKERIFL